MSASAWPTGWASVDPSAIPPPGFRGMNRAGVQVDLHTALQIDSVFNSCRVITNGITKMGDPRAFTEALDKNNEPYRQWLAEQPAVFTETWGGSMFQYDGIRRTVMSMALLMEAFWYTLEDDELGYPTALEVLNPVFMEVKPDKQHPGRVVYLYGAGADRKRLPNERITHIPFMAFPGGIRALNGIDYAGVTYALAIAAMEFGARFFSQGASPGYILSTDQKLGQDEIERIAEKYQVDHAGLQAAHTALVVDSGLKVQKIQSTPDEAQFLQTLDFARSCIAAWFGLPSHLVGGLSDKGNVWGKTVAEQGMQMVDFTFSGFTTPLCAAFASLTPKGVKAALDEGVIQRADPENLAKLIIAKRQASVETPNEIRVGDLRKGPLPDGDDLLTPMNSNASPAVGMLEAQIAGDADGVVPPAPEPNPDQED